MVTLPFHSNGLLGEDGLSSHSDGLPDELPHHSYELPGHSDGLPGKWITNPTNLFYFKTDQQLDCQYTMVSSSQQTLVGMPVCGSW